MSAYDPDDLALLCRLRRCKAVLVVSCDAGEHGQLEAHHHVRRHRHNVSAAVVLGASPAVWQAIKVMRADNQAPAAIFSRKAFRKLASNAVEFTLVDASV
jgi:hypothetical protein